MIETRLVPCLAALALLGGCSRDAGGPIEQRTPMPSWLPGVYSGTLPCSNCAAIEATLWLRGDGAFVFRQHLVDDEPQPSTAGVPSMTYGLGRWSWDEVAARAVLHGRGPERRLAVRDEGQLELEVASPHEHVLVRDAASPPFGDRLVLEGESVVTERGGTFKECTTGLTFRLSEAGAYGELRRRHRRTIPRGEAALTTVEGHLVIVDEESTPSERLVVDRFIAIKRGTGCEPGRA